MEKCSPVEMRKNLEIVESFKKIGMDFVAIPARDEDHKNELITQCNAVLEDMVSKT